ncbi:MAG: DUF885 domain-containing protein, partial [Gammaproteobacteria bacterium]|nr:DUF885 domain-containing protein [Gammaproteobacteria bacterium]
MKALFSIGFLVFLPAVSAAGELERFQELYEKEWAFRLQEFPEYATAIGVNDYNDKLTRVSLEDQERRAIYWRKVLEDLETIDTNGWSLQQRADYQIFHRQIRHFVEEYDTGADLIPLNSDWGFHMYLARLPSEVPLQNMRDYRNYLSRLKAIPDVIDEYIALMRRGIRLGFTQPKVVLDGREATIAAHVVDDVTDSVFYKPFANLKEAAGFSRRDVRSLQREGRSTVSKEVIPAYRKFLDFFVTEYVPNARDTLAAEALPGGEHFYQHQVKHYTTLDLTADEIHEIGLREVARIKA